MTGEANKSDLVRSSQTKSGQTKSSQVRSKLMRLATANEKESGHVRSAGRTLQSRAMCILNLAYLF